MRKFVVHTRPLPGCCQTGDAPILLEVEGQQLQGMEYPSTTWMREGEFYFRILKPESLHEVQEVKQADGSKKKVMVPPVYHSHAIYNSVEEARTAAERMVRAGMEFEVRKGRVEAISEEALQEKVALITTVMLP